MTTHSITELCTQIPPLDEAAMAAARARQDGLTKPQGSLGCLEALSIQLAGITGQPQPRVDRKAVIVLAGDHGIAAEGVSAYPSKVTTQMVLNFLRGGAAVNVLARQAGARVVIADVGVAGDLPGTSGPPKSKDRPRYCQLFPGSGHDPRAGRPLPRGRP